MMSEKKTIQQILQSFTRSRGQINQPFACDSEQIRIGDQLIGISIDEFSPEEDRFSMQCPEMLGFNLVAATISDLWASGVIPQFFLHSVCLSPDEDDSFVSGFMRGANRALETAGAFLIGGDVASGSGFRYTGVALGALSSRARPLNRVIEEGVHDLWVTGNLGDLNVAALHKSIMPQIEIRKAEAELIHQYGSACIDTSGGFFDSLAILSDQNRQFSFMVIADEIPIDKSAIDFCTHANIPFAASLIGGAGEYELLFTAPVEMRKEILNASNAMSLTRIGEVRSDLEQKGIWLSSAETSLELTREPPCPRAYSQFDEYTAAVMEQAQMIQPLFGERK